MSRKAFQDSPVFILKYQEVKDKTIVDDISIDAPYDLNNVTVELIRGGAIQITSQPQKSYFFKESDERLILTLTPQIVKSIIKEIVENESET